MQGRWDTGGDLAQPGLAFPLLLVGDAPVPRRQGEHPPTPRSAPSLTINLEPHSLLDLLPGLSCCGQLQHGQDRGYPIGGKNHVAVLGGLCHLLKHFHSEVCGQFRCPSVVEVGGRCFTKDKGQAQGKADCRHLHPRASGKESGEARVLEEAWVGRGDRPPCQGPGSLCLPWAGDA